VLLLSDEGVLSKSVSVLLLVVLDILDLGSELLSSGDEQVVDNVVSSVNIEMVNGYILVFLLPTTASWMSYSRLITNELCSLVLT
jgi:hypothetical protein